MSTSRRTWPMIILVIGAACGCLALGWWQWSRWESATGTFQNLGYALQWPFFAGFCVYAYRKYVRYEQSPPAPRSATEATEIPEGLLPERRRAPAPDNDDPALADYNAYLAELARGDAFNSHDQSKSQDRPDRTTA